MLRVRIRIAVHDDRAEVEKALMRSVLIFGVLGRAESRYALCRVCAKGTRRLHAQTGRIEDTINNVLSILAKCTMSRCVEARENVARLAAASATLVSDVGLGEADWLSDLRPHQLSASPQTH